MSSRLTTEGLPAAGPRCADCGVGSGPCVCTREYLEWEEAQERRDEEAHEWLAYVDRLLPVARPTDEEAER